MRLTTNASLAAVVALYHSLTIDACPSLAISVLVVILPEKEVTVITRTLSILISQESFNKRSLVRMKKICFREKL